MRVEQVRLAARPSGGQVQDRAIEPLDFRSTHGAGRLQLGGQFLLLPGAALGDRDFNARQACRGSRTERAVVGAFHGQFGAPLPAQLVRQIDELPQFARQAIEVKLQRRGQIVRRAAAGRAHESSIRTPAARSPDPRTVSLIEAPKVTGLSQRIARPPLVPPSALV